MPWTRAVLSKRSLVHGVPNLRLPLLDSLAAPLAFQWGILKGCGSTACRVGWDLDVGEAFEGATSPLGGLPHQLGIVADTVNAALEHGYQCLSGLVWSPLVDGVVRVDKEGADVVQLRFSLADIGGHDVCEFEEVEQQRLGHALELERLIILGAVFGCEVGDSLVF